ncbi:LLM class flavin-dependent oxidoreductase [Hydrogenophaga sp. 2FB]|uniref:LLM class flavin-dependent oxidoreductase n=1 Tax=Hydrogenophaga sp. 2FB TaxID=2502187 RepID=UPI0010F6023E|nr:LLM class flavin-dependent oxidoreductase [Hydrogenophaga sp. 2FB]
MTVKNSLNMGWFIPTSGDTGAFGDPSKDVASSFDQFERVAVAAERAGFEYVLVPTNQNCWEAWITATYLAARTSKLKMLVALKPGAINPPTLAKMVSTFDQISGGGRIYINLIAGANAAEARAEGLIESKEKRYQQMEEEIVLVKRLLSEEKVEFEGSYHQVHSPQILPKPSQRPYPPFFLGGGSEFAAEISAKHSSTHLFWGDYPDRIGTQITEMRARAEKYGRAEELRFAMRLVVVCRENEADAWAHAEQLIEGAEDRKTRMAALVANYDSVANNRQRELSCVPGNKLTPHLWSGLSDVRPGTGVAVVGNPEQVANQLREFIDVGCSGFCLSGYPHAEEAEIFGRLVMPLLRASPEV